MKTIFLLGDSTCAEKDDDARPETGWGMCLANFIRDDWHVVNLALNGRSTKSFLAEGAFDSCLHALEAGDYVIIQFGHNDNKDDENRHTDPWSTFQGNLAFMAEEVLSKGAIPLFLTPICRRRFVDGALVQTHGEYPQAMLSLCQARGYSVLDMTRRTFLLLQQLGPEGSKALFLHLLLGQHPNYPDGAADDTHLNEKGAQTISSMIVDLISSTYPNTPFLK